MIVLPDLLYLGIDIGTSSAKSILADSAGRVVAEGQSFYEIDTPCADWAEQKPGEWRRAVVCSVRQAVRRIRNVGSRLGGIGLTGQMHGLVMLDAAMRPLYPAIVWPDRRSPAQVRLIQETFGEEYQRITGSPAGTGFLLSSLLWVKDERPQDYHAIHTVLTPKDYIRLWLTGIVGMDPTDACGTGAYAPSRKAWALDVLTTLRIDPVFFPSIRASASLDGLLLPAAAAQLGLPPDIPVAVGCGDLQASALGLGVTNPDRLLINVGTGGQAFQLIEAYRPNTDGRIHTMLHADGENWHVMAPVLSAGLCSTWFGDLVGAEPKGGLSHLFAAAADLTACTDGLYFLPYLLGERTLGPGRAPTACFYGLRLGHGRRHLFRAVMEGVIFALYDCFLAMSAITCQPAAIRAGGGGLKDGGFRQLLADVFGIPVEYNDQPNTSAIGAAFLARCVTAGIPLKDIVEKAARISGDSLPDPARHAVYAAAYPRFREYVQLLSRGTG